MSESAYERDHELGVPMRLVCGSSLRWIWNVVTLCESEQDHDLGVWFLSEMEMEQCVPLR